MNPISPDVSLSSDPAFLSVLPVFKTPPQIHPMEKDKAPQKISLRFYSSRSSVKRQYIFHLKKNLHFGFSSPIFPFPPQKCLGQINLSNHFLKMCFTFVIYYPKNIKLKG
uniref:Uncharacterized protein n=1 Tax=Sphaerodactylus townsendi TaxID=933632 RepID=A0ACB8EK69_9SAUR